VTLGVVFPPLAPGDPVPFSDEWTRLSQPRNFWDASYEASGLEYFDAGDLRGFAILPKHENESEKRFERRRQIAMVRPLVQHLVDRYVDHVCRQAPHRKAEGMAAELLADVTGRGKSMGDLTRSAMTCALKKGVTYALLDNAAGGVYESQAQARDAGSRPIVREIEPEQVIWERTWDDQVTEAIIALVDREGSPFLWLVNEKNLQRVTLEGDPENPKDWRIKEVMPPVAHTYGGCPLVRKELGSEDSPVAGPWCESQRRIAVIESLLMEEIHNVTFTTIVFTNTSKETLQNVTVGSGMAICLTSDDRGNTPGVTKISADVSQAGSLRDQLAYEITELQRSAGLIAGSATQVGQPESGVARAFAFNEIEARLARLAEIGEGFERRIMELAAAGFSFAPADPVNWPREFAPMDLSAAVEAAGSLKINGAPPVLVSAAWEKLARHSLQIEPGSEKDAALAEQLQVMASAPRGPLT
jgi:hypothetical protein